MFLVVFQCCLQPVKSHILCEKFACFGSAASFGVKWDRSALRFQNQLLEAMSERTKKTVSVSLKAKYTDRSVAAGRRILMPNLRTESVNLGFLDSSRYIYF
jgi:hypothetical protein